MEATTNRSGGEMQELELYPRVNPLRATREALWMLRANWKQIVSYSLALVLIAGFAGYRWITTATPMDRSRAVELFRAERAEPATEANQQEASRSARDGRERETAARPVKSRSGDVTRSTVAASAAGADPSSAHSPTSSAGGQQDTYSQPQEGVYSWDTDGFEQVSGARREFPKETQRIITLGNNRSWTQHHYFSEEREIWTMFHWGSRGAEITKQRNKVTFGPVTNDSTIDFSPPMLVGPRDLRVGFEWGGEWDGDTYGDYSSKVFEHTTIIIGGRSVEVWGMDYVLNLHGKQEGTVTARVWLAPDHGLTVREHYEQDVESNGARYHAEWTQQLQSLQPER